MIRSTFSIIHAGKVKAGAVNRLSKDRKISFQSWNSQFHIKSGHSYWKSHFDLKFWPHSWPSDILSLEQVLSWSFGQILASQWAYTVSWPSNSAPTTDSKELQWVLSTPSRPTFYQNFPFFKLKPEEKSNWMKWWCSIPVFVQVFIIPYGFGLSRFRADKISTYRAELHPKRDCFIAHFWLFDSIIFRNQTIGLSRG